MTDKPSGIIAAIVVTALEAYKPIFQLIGEALSKIGEASRDQDEAQDDDLERQTQRAHRELIAPPVDHTHTHVTHTRTKPPAPARIYRRRTP